MTVIIVVNEAFAVNLYWSSLIQCLQKRGHKVLCVVPKGATPSMLQKIDRLGASVVMYPLQRRGLNPFYDVYSLLMLCCIFKKHAPHKIFATTIKPILYSALAAHCIQKIFRIPMHLYACITGLGYTFEHSQNFCIRAIQKGILLTLAKSLQYAEKVFFLNASDANVFVNKRLIRQEQCIVSKQGTGVDIDFFAYTPPNVGQAHFLLMARLLYAKGIEEYAAAAKIVKAKYPHTVFSVLGPEEHGPGAMNVQKITSLAQSITYLGAADDVREYVKNADVLVLPSWREGVPCAILEGMSMGRPAVVTKVPGCQDVVQDTVNGFCIPVTHEGRAQVQDLATAMEYFILYPEERLRMGKNARELMEKKYDARLVAHFFVTHMDL